MMMKLTKIHCLLFCATNVCDFFSKMQISFFTVCTNESPSFNFTSILAVAVNLSEFSTNHEINRIVSHQWTCVFVVGIEN